MKIDYPKSVIIMKCYTKGTKGVLVTVGMILLLLYRFYGWTKVGITKIEKRFSLNIQEKTNNRMDTI